MKSRSFKVSLLAALAVLGLGFAAAPPSAEAGGCQTRLSHHCGSCRGPVYKSSIIVGYQRCGTPIFRWVTAPHTCRHRHDSMAEIKRFLSEQLSQEPMTDKVCFLASLVTP